jgi:hypothetical protein
MAVPVVHAETVEAVHLKLQKDINHCNAEVPTPSIPTDASDVAGKRNVPNAGDMAGKEDAPDLNEALQSFRRKLLDLLGEVDRVLEKANERPRSLGSKVSNNVNKAVYVKEKSNPVSLAHKDPISVVAEDWISVEGVEGSSLVQTQSNSKPNADVLSPKVKIKAHQDKQNKGSIQPKLKSSFHLKPTLKWVRWAQAGETSPSGIGLGREAGETAISSTLSSSTPMVSPAILGSARGSQIVSEGLGDAPLPVRVQPCMAEFLAAQPLLLPIPSHQDSTSDKSALDSITFGPPDLVVSRENSRSGARQCVFRQDGTSKGITDDTLCLSIDGLRAKVAYVVVEKAHASSINFLGFVPASLAPLN